jgi:two-component system phosphate regulon sensor histidine kinase PhoR
MNRMAEQLDERIRTVLRQQNEREAMLSSMEEGVLAINNEGTILSLNKACASLLGEEPAKLQGRSIYEVIRKTELQKFIESALASASPVEGEIQLRGAQDRWVSAHGTVLHDSQRGKIGVLIVLHDVTRLRHLEDVRRDFVANVSHELRTPITSIKGFIETLVDGAFEDRENAHRFLQIMLRQVNRLDAIISDLLMLSRIERGSEEQRIELVRESIRGVLQAAIEMCEKKAIDKAIKIELVCPENLAGEINAALLEQAVVNLLDNAVKYSNSEAVIEVRAACEEAELVIRVKDQGCGIEAHHLPRLFERFYRVDKARSRELGGTGLGLAIVRHIALAHRGSVSVESTVGVGSTFCLRLPLSPANSPS